MASRSAAIGIVNRIVYSATMAAAIVLVCEALFFGMLCEPTFSFYASYIITVTQFTSLYNIVGLPWLIMTVIIAFGTRKDPWSRSSVLRLIGIPIILYVSGAALDLVITAFNPWTGCF